MDNRFSQATLKKGLELTLFVSLLTLGGMFLFTIDKEVWNKVLHVRSSYLVLAMLISFSMWIVGGVRIKLVARGLNKQLGVKDAVAIFLSGAFVSNVTPFASGGGPIQILLLYREGFSLGKATTVIITQFIIRLLFFGIVAPVLFFLYNDLINPQLIPNNIFDLLITLAFTMSLLIIYFAWQPEKIKVLAEKLKQIQILELVLDQEQVNEYAAKFYQEMDEFHTSIVKLTADNQSSLIWTGVFTIIYWLLFFSIAPVILLGLGVEPSFWQAFVVQTVFYLILPYIPTPGGSGLAEIGFAALFSSFVPGGVVGLLVLVWRFMTFYVVLIIGGVILLKILANSAIEV